MKKFFPRLCVFVATCAVLAVVACSGCGSSESRHDRFVGYGEKYLGDNDYYRALKQYQSALKYKPDSASTHFRIGQIYLMVNENDAAIKSFEKALLLDPNLNSARLAIIRIYADKGNSSRAIDVGKETIATYPDFFEAYAALAEIYVEQDKLEEASDCLDRLSQRIGVSAAPEDELKKAKGLLLCWQGKIALEKEYTQEAREYFLNSLEASSYSNVEAGKELISMYIAENKIDLAIGIAEKLLENYKGDKHHDVVSALCALYRSNGQHGKMFDLAQKVLKVYPDFTDLYYFVGLHAFEKKDYRNAVAAFEKIKHLESEKYRDDYFLVYAQSCIEVGNYKKAIVLFRRIIRRDPLKPEIHTMLIELYLKLGFFQKASQAAAAAADLFPERSEFIFWQSKTLLLNNQPGSAFKLLRKKYKQTNDPDYAAVLMRLEFAKNNYNAVRTMAGKVLESNPDSKAALTFSALACIQSLNYFQAKIIIGKLQGLYPDDPATIHLVALMYARGGDLLYALKVLDRGVEKHPGHYNFHLHRAQLYMQNGRSDLALSEYAAVEEKDPGNVWAGIGQALDLKRQERLVEANDIVAGLVKDNPGYLFLKKFFVLDRIAAKDWKSLEGVFDDVSENMMFDFYSSRAGLFYFDEKDFLNSPVVFKTNPFDFAGTMPLLFSKILYLQRCGDFSEALRSVERLGKVLPLRGELLQKVKISILCSAGEFEEARIELFQSGLDSFEIESFSFLIKKLEISKDEVFKREVPLTLGCALFFDANNMPGTSLVFWKMLHERCPKCFLFVKELAERMLVQEHFEMALNLVKPYYRTDHDSVFCLELLGRIFLGMGKKDKASVVLRKLKKKVSQRQDIYYVIGSIALGIGDTDTAMDFFKQAVKHNTDVAASCNEMANMLLDGSGSLSLAWEYASKAQKLEPRNVDYALTCGRILLAKERFQDALKMFELARRLKPSNADVLMLYAYACVELELKEKAIEAFENLRVVSPKGSKQYEELKKKLARLFSPSAAADDTVSGNSRQLPKKIG